MRTDAETCRWRPHYAFVFHHRPVRDVRPVLTSGAHGNEEPADHRSDDAHAPPRPDIAPPAAPARAPRSWLPLIILGTVLVTAILCAAGLLIAVERSADISQAVQAGDNLAQVLAEQTSRTLQPVDMTLREIQGRLASATGPGSDSATVQRSKETFDLLAERVKSMPQVDGLMVVGADGSLMNFSRSFPAASLDTSKRDYYQHFRTQDDHALFVSTPVRGYLAGKWTVFLGRRINDAHGGFAGVVMASVTLPYLEDFYRAVTPDNTAVTVLRSDGLVLVRYPPAEQQIGTRLPPDAPWYGIVETGGGSYRSPGYVGADARLVSVRALRDFPLVIDVSTIEAAALVVWRQQIFMLLAGALGASACVIFPIWLFGNQYNRLSRQNALLETGRQRFDAVLDNISQGLTFFDADQKLMVSNRRYAEIYHLSPQQVSPGTSLSDIVDFRVASRDFPDMSAAEYLTRRAEMVRPARSFDVIDEFQDGRAVSMHYQPLPGGGWVVTHEEITERRKAEATLAFMARHDALTELPNRTMFQERLVDAIATTRRNGHCALLCLDLDRFKVINDTLSHPVGDSLLRAVADRLTKHVRGADTVARLGGDEFAIILAGLRSPHDAAPLAERLIHALSEPYDIDGHRIISGASIGIAVAPQDGTLSDTLMRNADIALYLAKTEGRGTYRFFEPEIDAHIHRRRAVELDLRNARPAEDFLLHYQPVLDLGTGRVTGFEALIRWQHPVKGMISPAEFIPIAEETGLIVPIGAWVLRKACMEAASWPDDIEIAVNLSPVQFRRGQLLDVVKDALAESRLPPNRLELEITESTLLTNSGDTVAILHQLRTLGIRIALDDFGTGYSSLSYLRSFPFNKIKIDQSFVHDLETNKGSAAIIGAIVGLAGSLGMTTVAEGVETPRQLALLRDQGCAKVQGYLFSRPRPAGEVATLISGLHVPKAETAVPSAPPPATEAAPDGGSRNDLLLQALLTA